MKIKASTHLTKQRNTIIIREAKLNDAEGLIKCTKSYLNNDFIPLTKKEFNPTIEEHKDWIKSFIEANNNLLLVVECDDKIIGNIDLTLNKRQMLSHTGFVGMGVHEYYQNQGIGGIMIKKFLDWCANNNNIEVLWLMVFSTNHSGINLYKKFGFEENERQKNFIKTPDGNYIDNVIMTMNLKG